MVSKNKNLSLDSGRAVHGQGRHGENRPGHLAVFAQRNGASVSRSARGRIDLRNPQLFHEKIEWLKYFAYNGSPFIAKCYDKLAAREYAEPLGLGHIPVPLLGSWNRMKDTDWNIPGNCVYKMTNGCGNHVFHLGGKAADIRKDEKTLRRSRGRRTVFWLYGVKYACARKNRYICEIHIQGHRELSD